MGEGPYRCIICRWWAQLDDAIAVTRYGGCVCVACYKRGVEDERPMPRELRLWVSAAMG